MFIKSYRLVFKICLISILLSIIDILLFIIEIGNLHWNILQYLYFYGKTFIINTLFLLVVNLIYLIFLYVAGKLLKSNIINYDKMNKSLSFSIATIIVFIFSYSINIHYLPSIHNKISIIINSLLAFSILPFVLISIKKNENIIIIASNISIV
jgi:hypothetical protein